MKALSIKPPWPWLILEGIKRVENRTWGTSYRGPLLIHASKGWDQEGYEWIWQELGPEYFDFPEKEEHIFGAVVGMVTMTNCVQSHPSPWFFGPYGFVFQDPIKFEVPMSWKGNQRFFNIPDGSLELRGLI